MSRNHQPLTHTHIDAARLSSLLLPLVAFVIGFMVMFSRTSLQIAPTWAGYLSLAVLAGVDSVLGGVRAGMEGKFESDVFLSGFVVNIVFAVLLAWFGDAIGLQDVYLVAVLVFGWRIFLNISIIRRFFIARARASRAALTSAASVTDTTGTPEARQGGDVVGA